YKLLPMAEIERAVYEAPRNELEEKICKIWEEVLGVEKIGIRDDFFRLGGSSIHAIRATHKMRDAVHLHIGVADLFKYKTIIHLFDHLFEETKQEFKIPVTDTDKLPLSFAQERLWFIEQYESGTSAYHIPILLQISSEAHFDFLIQSLKTIMNRHSILRTVFSQDSEGKTYQLALKNSLEVEIVTCSSRKKFDEKIKLDINKPFNLSTEYPVKAIGYIVLEKSVKQEYYFLINFHHIAFDGWSISVFFNELKNLYKYHKENNTLELPRIEIQYKDFSVWQRKHLEGKLLEAQIQYWKARLNNHEELKLYTDKPRPSVIDYSGSYYHFNLGLKLSKEIRLLANQQGCTLYVALLAAFYILLHKHSGQNDIVLGTPIANRHYPQVLNLIGFFVNTIVLRENINPDFTAMEIIKQINNNLIEIQQYQDLPFEKLIDILNIEKDQSRHPIFQVAFRVQSFDMLSFKKESQGDFEFLDTKPYHSISKLDFDLLINDSETDLQCTIEYATSLFSHETIVSLSDHYIEILKQMISSESVSRPIREYGILTKKERELLLKTWNQTHIPYDTTQTVKKLFESQAEKTPDHIAVVFYGQSKTYRELNADANQLAKRIIKNYKNTSQVEINNDKLVLICMNRCYEMITAVLASVKAGVAYIPIDPNYPDKRIDYIIQDAKPSVILTQNELAQRLSLMPSIENLNHAINIIALDTDNYQTESSENFEINEKDTVAYVIYTSGTTGEPKGVLLSNQGLKNLCVSQIKEFNILPSDKVLQFSSLAFDAAVSEIFTTLLSGASLYIASESVRQGSESILDFMEDNAINVATIPPSLLSSLPYRILPNLKTLVVAGDICSDVIMKQWSKNRKLINAYGPTETTVCSTMHHYQLGDQHTNIGKPINNVKAYVLDKNLQMVPVGVPGELHIAGLALAKGYLNQPELTKEYFISNPFVTNAEEKKWYGTLYKTGDLVRWLPDGTLNYVGRSGYQIKLRGYRIELSEIENVIVNYETIKDACVIVKERAGLKYLVAYYISSESIDEKALSTFLSQSLPDYMLPNVFFIMETFPLTINGKIDRLALPEADVHPDKYQYISPRTKLESELSVIWKAVLRLEKIGVTDDFFRMGGDSILSIQLSSYMRSEGFDCSVKDIFDYRTIEQLANYLSNTHKKQKMIVETGLLKGNFGLLPIQSWFFEQIDLGRFNCYHHWNQAFLVKVPLLDTNKLAHILPRLIDKHDMLRARFVINSDPYQLYLNKIESPQIKLLDIKELDENTIHKILTEWQSNFDIEKGPLWCLGYLSGYSDNSARIFFAAHHLIIDAVSWRIIIKDLEDLYNGNSLSEKTSSYRQWVSSVSNFSAHCANQLEYWQEQVTSLPDYRQKFDLMSKSFKKEINLEEKLTQQLLYDAGFAYHTEINDLLLTALGLALQAWEGSDNHGVTIEGHGREHIDDAIDINQTIGWFTTIYPHKLVLSKDLSLSIKQIKENLRKIPNKGLGYSALRYQSKLLKTLDLPLISFNYFGQIDTSEKAWKIVPEDSGISMHPDNVDAHMLSLNGAIVNGKLYFTFVSRLTQELTDTFGELFQTQLIRVISHCVEKNKSDSLEFTPSDFKTLKISRELLGKLQKEAFEARNPIDFIYAANSLQQGFIYHSLAYPDDDAYHVQLLFDYRQALNIDNYKKAWQLAIQTYPILRTAFHSEENLMQVIYRKGSLDFTLMDLSELSDDLTRNKKISLVQQEDRKKRFDLSKPSLFRIYLFKQDPEFFTVMKSEYHGIEDGWSGAELLNKVHEYYEQLQSQKTIRVSVESVYCRAQEFYSQNQSEVYQYWENHLVNVNNANDLNLMFEKNVDLDSYRQVFQSKQAYKKINNKACSQLESLAKEEGLTLNVLVQYAWHKLLRVYTQDEQTIVGTTISGRSIPVTGIEHSVGLYINTLPLVLDWTTGRTVRAQLNEIHARITEMNNHCYVNLSKLQTGGRRLFHSLFVFENYPLPENQGGSDKLVALMRESIEKVDYALALVVVERQGMLELRLKYDGELLSAGRAQSYLETISEILNGLSEGIEKQDEEFSLLTKDKSQELLYEWNKGSYTNDRKDLVSLFESQAKVRGEESALWCRGESLSYEALNKRSNQVARYLRRIGVGFGREELVLLCVERGIDLVVGVLGILKAGGAYVPVLPEYPIERMDYILKDTKSKYVLTEKLHADKFKDDGGERAILCIDAAEYQRESEENLGIEIQSSDLAYVIYTSGTTGRPKGVLQEHGNVTRLFWSSEEIYDFNHQDVWTLYHAIVFDFSVWELWGALLKGGKLIIPVLEEVKDLKLFYDLCVSQRVSVLNQTPSSFYALSEIMSGETESRIESLKYIIFGGEALQVELLKKWWKYSKERGLKTELVNMYGITETTVHVTYKQLLASEESYSNIGKRLRDLKTYVLDSHMHPVPVGVVGELYVGGAGLARGYLNLEEQTQARFVENPYASEEDKLRGYTRLYKTGDLVRWRAHGDLEYIGRNDFQVKLRGHRIELGEIEHVFASYEGIEQVCVLLSRREVGEETGYLVGYYVSPKEIESALLSKHVSERLPEYMVPSAYVWMSSFPFTENGKLDRAKLPKAEFKGDERDYVAPRTELEKQISEIWSNILGIEKVGVTDDFFRLGGDSILSIQLTSRLRTHQFNCSVTEILNYRTIESLAQHLTKKKITDEMTVQENVFEGKFALLPIQSWFFKQVKLGKLPNYQHWNQSFLVKVPNIPFNQLLSAVNALIEKHDGLRLIYTNVESDPKQSYQKIQAPEIKVLDVSSINKREIFEILTGWQSHFDIANGPTWCIGYLKGYEDGFDRIFMAFHHLIIDAVSWRILVKDLKDLLDNIPLNKKTSSYYQWVNFINVYHSAHSDELEYWTHVCNQLPDYKDQFLADGIIHGADFQLDSGSTKKLLTQANEAYHTEVNHLLLTALASALKEWNGEISQFITLEGHGRESIHSKIDVSETVGWFTTMFPVQLALQESLSDSIKRIKEDIQRIPNKGIGFGSFLYQNQNSKEWSLPPITFNYLGQFDVKDSLWQIDTENSGSSIGKNNQMLDLITINAMVVKGHLQCFIRTQLSQSDTTKIKNVFEKKLKEIITHCIDKVESGFTEYTVTDFETVNISKELLTQIQSRARELNNPIEAIFPANSLQQGFIYHALSQPEDDAYRVQLILDYHQKINIKNYEKSWGLATEVYPILRTAFNWEEQPIQIIYKHSKPLFEYVDISHLSDQSSRDFKIEELIKSDRVKAFDLSIPCLLRLTLIKQSDQCYTLIKTEHHSIADGWSGPILLNRVHKIYQQLQLHTLPSMQVDEAYLMTQKYHYQQRQACNDYWLHEIQSVENPNDLNGFFNKPVDLDSIRNINEPTNTDLKISGKLYKEIIECVRKQGLTLNVLLQFAWHKLIQIYTQDAKTIVGSTISGRSVPVHEVEKSVGLYINTLPLIINWDNDLTILEQMRVIHEKITHMNNYGFFSLSKLQKDGQRLFHSIFIFENYPVVNSNDSSPERLNPTIRQAIEKLDYPMAITVHESNETIHIKMFHDNSLLNDSEAKKILDRFELLVSSAITQCNQPHHAMSLLSDADYKKIMGKWNHTETSYSMTETIVDLFEKQAQSSPNEIAVIFENQELTYSELNQRANQLAHYLLRMCKKQTHQSQPKDMLIALCLDRSLELIISVLAVLKLGATYVPMDTNYPSEKIKFIIEDTASQFVLTHEYLSKNVIQLLSQNTELITVEKSNFENENKSNLGTSIAMSDLAYVIYTSGTTGKPKGVAIPHKGIANRVDWMQREYLLKTGDRVLQKTPYIFDVSVWELLWAICYGATLVIAKPNTQNDPMYLTQLIADKRITHMHFVPSMLAAFNTYLIEHQKLYSPTLRHLFCSGEALSTQVCDQTYQLSSENSFEIHNLYGPTECSIDVSYYKCQQGEPVTIGKPIQNTKLLILDKYHNLLPEGIVGELYIAGISLARGYLNQAQLTNDRFIPSLWSDNADYKLMYKTGDLVRWLPDGNIEYLGRNDFQVKIRGYRIELAEIESNILSFPQIEQAVVILDESKHLIAYFVSKSTISTEDLREHLSHYLSQYMMPDKFVAIDKMPLTPTGKLDRRALPKVECFIQDQYVAPRNPLESDLCSIWQELLGVDKVSITDDFFRMGGDSILSIQLSTRLHRKNIHCNVKDIFDYRTVENLAAYIELQNNKISIVAEQEELSGDFDWLPIQSWFFSLVSSQKIKYYQHWNQAFLFKVPELDCHKLLEVINDIILHHDMLRTIFPDWQKRKKQHYQTSMSVQAINTLDVKNLNETEMTEQLTQWQSHFNIEQGPLWSISYLYGYQDGSARIYFAFHHLIADTVSWRIIIDDIKEIYLGGQLTRKTSSYRQWVDLIREYPKLYPEEIHYWQSQREGLDRSHPFAIANVKTYRKVSLNDEITNKLLNQANQAYSTTINDLLLTALAYSLKSCNREHTQYITIEGHGRESIKQSIDVGHTFGWFTVIYPVRLILKDTLGESLKSIKEGLRLIPNKGIGYGAFFNNDVNTLEMGEFTNLPGIMFNYLGQFNTQDGFWQITNEYPGLTSHAENRELFLLTINAAVIDGQIHFNVTSQLESDLTDKLVEHFKKTLLEIVDHCFDKSERNEAEHTVSDFNTVTISQELLEELESD
ncbi:MAG: amino acid adenylation domain-containing protein, partial [Proteobacteria bacterium]|nr:amino acid adenylation domain-containing protein [Pseudomonadota bacterium]